MTRLHMVLLIFVCIGANVLQSGAETLLITEGDMVTLSCSLSGTFQYPVWLGPPNLSKYTNLGLPAINSAVNASARLSYASNRQDLLLANAVVADSGEYKCSFPSLEEHTFSLKVSGKTSTRSTRTSASSPAPAPRTVALGVSIGVCVFIVLAVLIGVCCFRKHCNKNENKKIQSYSNGKRETCSA